MTLNDPTHADAVLEALSLERQPATPRFLEELFLRFQRRVACETLTRAPGDPDAFDAQAFFADWVEEERGLVGEERARAFAWLAKSCGFETATPEGTCRRPWEDEPTRDEQCLGDAPGGFSLKVNAERSHRGVIAAIAGRRILADGGFPLPVLLPLDRPATAAAIPTGMGELSVSVDDSRHIVVTCDARGEVTELLRLFPTSDPSLLPFKELSRTLPDAPRKVGVASARDPFALRVLDDRVLFWRGGRMTILDAWSRLEYPLPATERAALAKIFALELDGIALPDAPRAGGQEAATLSVFHLSPVAPDDVRGRIGRDALPLRFVSGREEHVEAAGKGSRVTIRATLADVPPEGPGEAVRKTLVFHLVSEIFALVRRDGAGG